MLVLDKLIFDAFVELRLTLVVAYGAAQIEEKFTSSYEHILGCQPIDNMPLQSLLMLVASVVGCRAFSSSVYHYHRQINQQYRYDCSWRRTQQRPPPWPRETSISLHKKSSDPDRLVAELKSVYAAVAASFIFVGSSFILADQTASAIDTQSFNMLQRDEHVAPRSGNSIEVAFQGFIWKGSTLRTKLTDLPTLLNSDKSTAITKEMSAEQLSDADINDANFVRFDELPYAKPQTMSLVDKKSIPTAVSSRTTSTKPKKGELKATDVKKIAKENRIEVELDLKDDKRPLDVSALKPPTIVKIDRETWNKVRIVQPPFLPFLPSSVQPLVSRQFSLQVLKEIPNNQLFVASVLAGSLTEMVRTSLLYPLATVKARVQARRSRTTNRKRSLSRKLRISWLTFLHEAKRGDWYAGILPTILITVPASGVYQVRCNPTTFLNNIIVENPLTILVIGSKGSVQTCSFDDYTISSDSESNSRRRCYINLFQCIGCESVCCLRSGYCCLDHQNARRRLVTPSASIWIKQCAQ